MAAVPRPGPRRRLVVIAAGIVVGVFFPCVAALPEVPILTHQRRKYANQHGMPSIVVQATRSGAVVPALVDASEAKRDDMMSKLLYGRNVFIRPRRSAEYSSHCWWSDLAGVVVNVAGSTPLVTSWFGSSESGNQSDSG